MDHREFDEQDYDFQMRRVLGTLFNFKEMQENRAAEKEKILPIREWLASEYHTGEIGKALYPFWKDQMATVFAKDDPVFNEVIITGATGTGKSFFSLMCWLRMLYILSNLPNPQKALKLAPSSRILMAYLSVSVKEASLTGFGELRSMLDIIPYFREVYKRNPKTDSILEFPDGVTIICGSNELHFIGANMISMIFDETNFVKSGGGNPGDFKKAWNIYESAKSRITNRFSKRDIRKIAMNMLVSSNTNQMSFTESAINIAQGVEATKIISAAVYEAHPEGTYSDSKFLFYCGDDLNPPFLVDKKDKLIPTIKDTVYEKLPEEIGQDMFDALPTKDQLRFRMVPDDFRDMCTRFPERAVQDIIGYSISARGKFFTGKLEYNACVELGQQYGLKHLFTQQEITIGLRDSREVKDYINIEALKKIVGRRPCYIHVDQSIKGDSTGLSLAFPYERTSNVPAIMVPLMIRINPPVGNDKISIQKLREFIEYLDAVGLWVEKVTYDQYQSEGSLQILQSQGFNAEKFSVDAIDTPWVEVCDQFYFRRIFLYDYEPFRKELYDLIHDREKRKVDHPKGGSKDVADSFVGAVYNCLMAVDSTQSVSGRAETITSLIRSSIKPVNDRDPAYLTQKLMGQQYHIYDRSAKRFVQFGGR